MLDTKQFEALSAGSLVKLVLDPIFAAITTLVDVIAVDSVRLGGDTSRNKRG